MIRPNTPILLVATHVDVDPTERVVSHQEARGFAWDHGLAGFVEVSAVTGVGVAHAAESIVKFILNHDDSTTELFGKVATHVYTPTDW